MSRRHHSAIRNSPSALFSLAGWVLCVALLYAPWNYGSVSEPGVVALNFLLGTALVLRLVAAGLQVSQRTRNNETIRSSHFAFRNFPPALLIPIALLLLLGWFTALNAKAIYDSDFYLFVPVTAMFPGAPGAVDQATAVAMMVRVTLLLGSLCLVAEMVRDPRWLLRLWWTIGLAGGSIAFLGLMQKASGAPMTFWRETEHPSATFFATFYYHANAGAYLNLVLPVILGLAWRAYQRPGQPLVRALWLSLAVISAVAVFSNTSRMSQALGAGILLVLVVGLLPTTLKAARARFEWGTALAGALALAFAFYAVVQTSRLDRSFERWDNLGETMSKDSRWHAQEAAWKGIPEGGWVGFGPGTFAVIFPYFTAGAGADLGGRWLSLHEDYLQALLEWGWLGSGLWGWLFLGGMGVGGVGAVLAVKRERRRNAKRGMPAAAGKLHAKHRVAAASRPPKGEGGNTGRGGAGSDGLQAAEGVLENAPPSWSPRQRLFLPLVLLGLGSVELHALVDYPLQVASIQLYVATYLGVCWGSTRWGRVRAE